MAIVVKLKRKEVDSVINELSLLALDTGHDGERIKKIVEKLETAKLVRAKKTRKRELLEVCHDSLKAFQVLANGNGGDMKDFHEGGVAYQACEKIRKVILED